jgi:hypothetical protein
VKVGQNVGIALQSTSICGATAESLRADIANFEASVIWSEKDHVNIDTGESTYVGDRDMEFDVNTFGGFSGTIELLLDRKEPPMVEEADFEKQFLRFSTILHTNFGFKL